MSAYTPCRSCSYQTRIRTPQPERVQAELQLDTDCFSLVPSARPPSPSSPLSSLSNTYLDCVQPPRKRRICSTRSRDPRPLVAPQPVRRPVYPSPPLSATKSTIALPAVDGDPYPDGPLTRCASSPACLDRDLHEADMALIQHHNLFRLPPSPPPTLPTPTLDLPLSTPGATSYGPRLQTAYSLFCDNTLAPPRVPTPSPLTPVSPTRTDPLMQATEPVDALTQPLSASPEDITSEDLVPLHPPAQETSLELWDASHRLVSPLIYDSPVSSDLSILPRPGIHKPLVQTALGPRQTVRFRDSIELRQDQDRLDTPLTPVQIIRLPDRLHPHLPSHFPERSAGRPFQRSLPLLLEADNENGDASTPPSDDLASVPPQGLADTSGSSAAPVWCWSGSFDLPLLQFRNPFPTSPGEDSHPWPSHTPVPDSVDTPGFSLDSGDSPVSVPILHRAVLDFPSFAEEPESIDDVEDARMPSARQSLKALPDLDPADEFCAVDNGVPHIQPSPSRRSYSELPDLGLGLDSIASPSTSETSGRAPALRLLSFPGADTDDDLVMADNVVAPEAEPPSVPGASSLGIFVPIAPASTTTDALPSREAEPDLDFPPAALAKHSKYCAPIIALRRRTWFLERNAKRAELEAADEVRALAAGLRLSPPVPGALAEYDRDVGVLRPPPAGSASEIRRSIQVLEAKRAEARRDRKLHKDRGKEVQALLGFKLGKTVSELERKGAAEETGDTKRDGQAKVVIAEISHLVARMVFKRREATRPLAGRRLVYEKIRSPLSLTVPDEDEDGDQAMDVVDDESGLHATARIGDEPDAIRMDEGDDRGMVS